ncbi:amino acid ABC transporter permease [Pandoraea anhela]|uniref:Amino acid ABC transporter permease n=1 Tax=Pandoraea anhela TaxID=2508295 RepID=A0A5E4W9L5_9BURK|nr:amino acid ABC transporter permease [Pandoraea anhela]VVE21121.1 amino acid ABC transporter permease [Pandoraea anhela]
MLNALDFGAIFAAPYGQQLVRGLWITLRLTLNSWILAMLIGIALATLHETRIRPFERFVAAFVAYHRNVPILVQIFLWYFGMPQVLPVSVQTWVNAHNGEITYASIAIGLCMSAYVSEDIRSGLRAIPLGQHEASRALGMSFMQSMRLVVLPQAIRHAMPLLINHTVLLFKSTSLAMVIGAAEVTYTVRQIENETFRTFSAYAVATAFYLCVSVSLMLVGEHIAKRSNLSAR